MILTNLRELKLFFDVVVARREQVALELERTGELRGGKSFTSELKEHNKKQAAELKAKFGQTEGDYLFHGSDAPIKTSSSYGTKKFLKTMQEKKHEIDAGTIQNFDRLLGEIVNGMAAVAILGASIILFAALWGIIYHDKVLSEKHMELSPTVASFGPVP